MPSRDIGAEILEGIQEIKRFKRGELNLKVREWSAPTSPKTIRAKLDLSQDEFAALMGVSARTVQEWEQGRRSPSGPARALLRIAEQHPEVFQGLK